MYTDSTGMWCGFDDLITGPIDEIIAIGILAIGAYEFGNDKARESLDGLVGVIDNTLESVSQLANDLKIKSKIK